MANEPDCGLVNTILKWILGLGTTLFSAYVAFRLQRRTILLAKEEKKKEEESHYHHDHHRHSGAADNRTQSNGAEHEHEHKRSHERGSKTQQ